MANFTVRVQEVHYVDVIVEAPNAVEAKKKVNAMLEDGSDLPEPEYGFTMDSDEWLVTMEN